MAPPRPASPPLGAALDDEIGRLERVILRAWQGLATAGIIGSLVIAVVVPGRLGVFGAGLSGAYLLAFTGLAELWRRRFIDAVRWANPLVESTIPWTFLFMVAAAQGPVYALGSWVPPMLFGALMIASIVRLRPQTPLVLGAAGALIFELSYLAYLKPQLTAEQLAQPLLNPRMQLVRSVSLAFSGAFAMAVTYGLTLAIGKAARTQRAQDLFGKYQLKRKIAAGGMGVVYEALYCPEGGFERPAAVKRVHDHLVHDERFVEAFRNEAELCARLVHPNIVQVLDFGRVDGSYYLAMEYVEGLTVYGMVRRLRAADEPMPLPLCALIGREVLAALAYSHEGARDKNGALLRVIHRDVSPANVLVSRSGQVKLTDFGVAKALREARASVTGNVPGHVGYMAPEQVRTQPVDERTDLFALGVVLWELVAGRPLFTRDNEGASLMAVLGADVPCPSSLRADVDPRWDAFLMRALERDPVCRFASAGEMLQALDELHDARSRASSDALGALVCRLAAMPLSLRKRPLDDPDPTAVDPSSEAATHVSPNPGIQPKRARRA